MKDTVFRAPSILLFLFCPVSCGGKDASDTGTDTDADADADTGTEFSQYDDFDENNITWLHGASAAFETSELGPGTPPHSTTCGRWTNANMKTGPQRAKARDRAHFAQNRLDPFTSDPTTFS